MTDKLANLDCLPRIGTYGQYTSSNYGQHCRYVRVGCVCVYYSYDTPVAFSVPGVGLVVLRNYWSTTTGKHLNWVQGIDGRDKADLRRAHKRRVSQEVFTRLWNEAVAPLLGKVQEAVNAVAGDESTTVRRARRVISAALIGSD